MSPHVRPSVPGIGSSRLMVWILRLCFCRSLWTAEAIALQAIVLNSYLYKSGRRNQFFTVSRYRNITTSNQSSTGRRCDRRKRNTRLKFCSATACSAGDSGLSWAGTSYPSSLLFSSSRASFSSRATIDSLAASTFSGVAIGPQPSRYARHRRRFSRASLTVILYHHPREKWP